jgi:hypothetical protein
MRYECVIKPESCPACGSPRVAKILYGKPKYTPELIKRVEAGEITYGGCVIKDDQPFWKCVECLIKIYPKRGNVSV